MAFKPLDSVQSGFPEIDLLCLVKDHTIHIQFCLIPVLFCHFFP